MSGPNVGGSLVLGVHPTSRGFGWAAFTTPLNLYHHGLHPAQGDKNTSCLEKLAALIEELQPETLVLEAFDAESSLRSARIRTLCLAMVSLAAEQGLEVTVYKREEVRASFASAGAKSRDDVAAAVARAVPALAPRLPAKRKLWIGEDKRLSIFAAAALALTHYQNGAAALLNDLRNAA